MAGCLETLGGKGSSLSNLMSPKPSTVTLFLSEQVLCASGGHCATAEVKRTSPHCFREASGKAHAPPHSCLNKHLCLTVLHCWTLCSGCSIFLPFSPQALAKVSYPKEFGHLPNFQLLSKHEVVVEVSNGPVHSIAISHLHHGSPRLAFHEFHLGESSHGHHHCPANRDLSPTPSKLVRSNSCFHILTYKWESRETEKHAWSTASAQPKAGSRV